MLWFGVACLLHLIAGFFYVSSGLIAPLWGILMLLAIWLILVVVLIRMRKEGTRTLIVPAVAATIWFLTLWVGGRFLDWRP